MSIQSSMQDAITGVGVAPAASSLSRRHEVATARIQQAFERQQHVAMLVGVDRFELGQVVSAFVDNLGQRTTSVRLRSPQENALAALGEINRAIGFDPKDLTLSDLQNVLKLFLEYQHNHHHRTVLCVEQADEQSMWVLDCIARLVASCKATPVGDSLLVILTGSTRLTEVLENTAFDVIRAESGTPVRMGPLSIFETREFVRNMIESGGYGDIQSLFEFDAVERLHNLSGGIPSVVAKLFRECMSITRQYGRPLVTSKVVATAARNLRADATIDAKLVPPKPALISNEQPVKVRRLVLRYADRPETELVLKPGRFMIGRARTADIRLPSPTVSRRHALLIDTGDTVEILDLGSVNGVHVNGERVVESALEPGSVVTLGDCKIEYQAGN